jgi:hypothetical protein
MTGIRKASFTTLRRRTLSNLNDEGQQREALVAIAAALLKM